MILHLPSRDSVIHTKNSKQTSLQHGHYCTTNGSCINYWGLHNLIHDHKQYLFKSLYGTNKKGISRSTLLSQTQMVPKYNFVASILTFCQPYFLKTTIALRSTVFQIGRLSIVIYLETLVSLRSISYDWLKP